MRDLAPPANVAGLLRRSAGDFFQGFDRVDGGWSLLLREPDFTRETPVIAFFIDEARVEDTGYLERCILQVEATVREP